MKGKLLISSALLSCALLAVTADDAEARRGGGGWFRANYARSFYAPGWTHSQTLSRTTGGYSGVRSFQRPSGFGATRQFNANCAGGTCSRNYTTTRTSGRTSAHSGSITGGNGAASWQASGKGPYGGTSARQGTCTPGAGCNSNVTATGAGGGTYTAQRSFTPNGQGGLNYNATFTGPNGTVTRSFP